MVVSSERHDDSFCHRADDNQHRYEEEWKRRLLGSHDDRGAAIRACKELVDGFLLTLEEKTADDLIEAYRRSGEDPWICSDDPGCAFDAWTYAEQRCRAIQGADRDVVWSHKPVGRPASPDRAERRIGMIMIKIPTKLMRVKAEVLFQADDPWNENRPGTFTVDTYATTFMKVKAIPADTKEPKWAGGFNRALRSETDGVTRLLPESLVELWQTQQIPTAALPGLLLRIGPQLKESDYRPLLHDRKMKVMIVVEVFLCVFLVALSVFGAVAFEATLWVVAVVVLGTAGVCWLFLYLLFFQRLSRRKRQMRWLLAQTTAGNSA